MLHPFIIHPFIPALDGLAGPTGGPGEEGHWGGSLELFEGPQAEEEEEEEEEQEEEEQEEGKMDLLTSSLSSSVMSMLHHSHYTVTTTTPPPPGHLHPADTAVPDISKLWLTGIGTEGIPIHFLSFLLACF